MLKVIFYSTLVASIAGQAFGPGQPPAPFLPPEYVQYPGPVPPPLTPFNVAPDGYYGFNPYQPAFGPAIAQPNPALAVNNGIAPQNRFVNPAFNTVVPPGYPPFLPPQFINPGFQRVPPFPPTVPQQLPPQANAFPNQPVIVQHGRPFSDATAVSFANFQANKNQTAPAGAVPTLGVNGAAARPVSSATLVNSNVNGSIPVGASYGAGFIQYAPASVNPAPIRTLNPAVPSTPRGFPTS